MITTVKRQVPAPDLNSEAIVAPSTARLTGMQISVTDDPQAVSADWKALEPFATTPFGDRAWSTAWYDAMCAEADCEPVIVTGRTEGGTPLFLLPLVRVKRGPFSLLMWPGATHAPYHSGLFSNDCRALVTADNAATFWQRIFDALPKADALIGYGLPAFEAEAANPLGHLPYMSCGCHSYRFRMDAEWDHLYTAKVSTKQIRNDRRCERRLAEFGDLRFRVAVSAEERRALLETMLQQKSQRLRAQGRPDFTRQPGVRNFYDTLAGTGKWIGDRGIFMSAVDCGGQTLAINFGAVHGGEFHGLILSMSSGEWERWGPGRLLLRRTMEHLARHGFTYLDFGVGDDAYKDVWADEVVERRDVVVPLTLKGEAFVAGLKLALKAKTTIKTSPALWRMFSQCRRYLRF